MKTYDEVIKVDRLKAGQYKAFIPESVCTQSICHGGILISLIQLAIEQSFKHDYTRAHLPHLFELHSSLLRPTGAGDVDIQIKEARLGPSTATILFDLIQGSKTTITGFATHTNFTTPHPTLLVFPYKNPPRFNRLDQKPPNFSSLESNTDPNWIRVTFKPDPEIPIRLLPYIHWFMPTSLALSSSAQTTHNDSQTGIEMWICPSTTTTTFKTHNLGFVVDMMPRLAESIRPDNQTSHYTVDAFYSRGQSQRQGLEFGSFVRVPVAYPTLSLSLEIKRPLPEEGVRWLFLRSALQWYEGGKWDMEVVVWDQDLNIVATSRLLSLVVDLTVAGNLARRRAAAEVALKKGVDKKLKLEKL